MTKSKDDNQFFDNLKSKMKSNADKMKGDNAIEKDKPKDKEEIDNKKIEGEERREETKVEREAGVDDSETEESKELTRTYYLKKSIVQDIDDFAKKTGNNKSYLVELALTYYLGQADVKERLSEKISRKLKIDTDKLVIEDMRNQKKVRRTYYLKADLIERLDLIAEEMDKDKSFIVEKALRFLFENAEIK